VMLPSQRQGFSPASFFALAFLGSIARQHHLITR
jgi:hypothetical protein